MPKKSNILMIKLKNRRKFFTHHKNLPMLIEFAKIFHAEIALVEADSAEILELENLAQAICEPGQPITKQRVEVLQQLYPMSQRKRQTLLKNATLIKKYIRARLLDNKSVSLKELKKRYNKLELTDSCLCNHFAHVRKELEEQGHRIEKVGAGKYCVMESVTS